MNGLLKPDHIQFTPSSIIWLSGPPTWVELELLDDDDRISHPRQCALMTWVNTISYPSLVLLLLRTSWHTYTCFYLFQIGITYGMESQISPQQPYCIPAAVHNNVWCFVQSHIIRLPACCFFILCAHVSLLRECIRFKGSGLHVERNTILYAYIICVRNIFVYIDMLALYT